MHLTAWSKLKLRKWVIHPVMRRIYVDDERDIGRAIVVAGSARSGTTWLAELLASKLGARIIFEPFNSNLPDGLEGMRYLQYLEPSSQHDFLYSYCYKILSGEIRNPKVDLVVESLRPSYRIVKTIRSGMFLRWMNVNFPQIPILFIIRHPCAVVLSRMECGWDGEMDVGHILEQEDLVAAFLSDQLDLMKSAATQEAMHAIAWCVTNLVPLRQFPMGSLQVIFYEDLCERPVEELGAALNGIGIESENLSRIDSERPSFTSLSSSAVLTGGDRIGRWKKQLSSSQIKEILSIVRAFGLGELYGDSIRPLDPGV